MDKTDKVGWEMREWWCVVMGVGERGTRVWIENELGSKTRTTGVQTVHSSIELLEARKVEVECKHMGEKTQDVKNGHIEQTFKNKQGRCIGKIDCILWMD